MGLFGSSKKTVVGTAVMRVIDDDNMPDTLGSSLIEAVFNGENIPDTFLENILNGGTVQIEAMYQYAEQNYYYGLPNATVLSNQAGSSEVKTIIENEIGKAISLRYVEFLPLSNTHIGWQTLVDSYGYDHQTNEITTLSASVGFKVYLDDLIAIHTQELVDEAEGGSLRDLGPAGRGGYTPERPANSAESMRNLVMTTAYEIGPEEGVDILTVYKNGLGELVRDSIFVPLTGYNLEPEYFQCGYTYLDSTNSEVYGYWTYEFDSGTHPELDSAFDRDENAIGTYFPFVFFRNNKTNLAADSEKDTEAYKTSDRVLGYLGMSYADIGNEVNENPDIGDVQQAYMMMGISANSTNQADLHYLYEYFSRLGTQTLVRDPEAVQERPRLMMNNNGLSNNNALMISDTHSAMRLSYYNITTRLVAGKIGKPGEYGTRTGSKSMTREVRRGRGNGYYETQNFTIPQRIYQKQINDSMYEELVVTNPKMMYDIAKNYSHTAVVGEEELLIPLDKAITDQLNLIDKEELYARSLHFIFNSKITQKVEWYESSFFKFTLIAVSVVLTVLSAGSAWQSVVLAAGVGVGALAYTLVTIIVKVAVYNYAFELTIKELGLEDSFLASVLAIVAAMYLGASNGGIKNAPWASELLTASNGLLSGVKNESTRLASEYNAKSEEFELMKEEAVKELEEAQKALDVDTLLDPLEFVGLQPQNMLGEKPQDYYQRAIHQGNLGTLAFDAISSYVENSLTLPEIYSTIGEVNQ